MIFLENVKEHAPPLAGVGVETGVKVHVTRDVANRAASGGCCVSTCWASLSIRRIHDEVDYSKLVSERPRMGRVDRQRAKEPTREYSGFEASGSPETPRSIRAERRESLGTDQLS